MQTRRPRTVFHYKVDHLLGPPDATEYEALLLDPRTTVDAAHAWLAGRGYALSRSAVARHRRRFLASRETARQKAAESEVVLKNVLFAARQAGPEGFAAALLGGLQLALFNHLMEIEDYHEFPAGHYLELSKGIAVNIRAQREVMEMQFRARQPPGSPPSEDPRPRRGSRNGKHKPPAPPADASAHLTEAERHDALLRKVWSILEPNRPIEMFLDDDPAPTNLAPTDPDPDTTRP